MELGCAVLLGTGVITTQVNGNGSGDQNISLRIGWLGHDGLGFRFNVI